MSDQETRSKREREAQEEADPDFSNDVDIGPALPAPDEMPKKKKRVLLHERIYMERLPSADMYERSYMHRDVLNFVAVTKTDFIITTSVDGHLKFWKKNDKGIEFVKHFRAHIGNINCISVSADGLLLATGSVDKALKVFDVINFDMINMMKLEYVPNSICWVHKRGQAQSLLASSNEAGNIFIYDGRGDGNSLYTVPKLHSHPVHLMTYNEKDHAVISADTSGMLEYWVPEEPFGLPKTVSFEFKADTDLYEFKKAKTHPTSIKFSSDYNQFVTMSIGDRQVRVFRFKTGKMIRKYDESLAVVSEMQQAGTTIYKLDDMEFGRRLAVERELEKTSQASTMNAVFDESGNFIIYPTMLGVKVVKLLGKTEPNRFLNVSLYQGAPNKKALVTMEMAASDNPLVRESESMDPTLFCTAYKRNRFFMFTKREPDAHESHKGDRDVYNEKPTREEQTVASTQPTKQKLGNTAILRTTSGDIHIRLFPEYAPKAVENFVTHSKNGYYNNVIFHRVIKGFMIQTGDPLGDGTGGVSIWGNEFEDEFHRDLRHDRPYTVSMANAGPNTNGSQFFITVVPTPWLNNKHTIFGRATAGMDVIHTIENSKTDKMDKPYDDIKVINIEIR
ncbi:3521_t:CDS:10 [Funneliformis geosporum]|uniref:peptidylprolyl isomerase n=1 Tax=Funneliformis geosporum TaxID=1117311 RepID=A0A9W4SAW2_9GLOM|nr:13351_t:CDS:10 [Funneliformis geosporum]CAI2163381.1 3521_t:CDS:10 [Funneliformis geosporum]